MNPTLNGRNNCEPENTAPWQFRGENNLPAAEACRGASGDDEARTRNLRLAKPALSQLSYVPKIAWFIVRIDVLALSGILAVHPFVHPKGKKHQLSAK